MKQKELSQHRKEQMAASLKKLMARKNLQKITIQDIADDCNMNRYTFYYHFQDIYDLVSWTFRRDFEQLFTDRANCSSLNDWIQILLEYLKENEAVCKCALNSLGRVSLRKICVENLSRLLLPLLKELRKSRRIPDDYLNFLANFYLEAVCGVMIQWILGEMAISEEDMIDYLHTTLEGTLEQALDRFQY